MAQILIVEDETTIRSALTRLLKRHDYEVAEADSVEAALQLTENEKFDLIISDLRLPGAPGTDLIRAVDDTPVLIMTSYASVQSAVDSMALGAAYYVAKPFDHDDMLEKVRFLLEESATDDGNANENVAVLRRSSDKGRGVEQLPGMIGRSEGMKKLYHLIRKAAPTDCRVLIHGETGTGKELVAGAIHRLSPRAEQPLISVNCAAIPETLIESELFGYERGAFTGANTSRGGLVEAADGGCLFLDEIGELPLEAQARLLRFIQESEVRRIGATQSKKVDVRLLCATHRDLKSMTQSGRFREDLFYRINVMRMDIPPLRERGQDILEIAETLLDRACKRLGCAPKKFSPKAIQAITTYVWPGNVRELENAVERAVILCDSDEIDNDVLGIDLKLVDVSQLRPKTEEPAKPKPAADTKAGEVIDEELSLEDYFQRFVLEHQDSMSETELAQKLGVSRKCLWERRQRLGMPRKKATRSAGNRG